MSLNSLKMQAFPLTSVKAVSNPLWSQGQTREHVHAQHTPRLSLSLYSSFSPAANEHFLSSSWSPLFLVQIFLCYLKPKKRSFANVRSSSVSPCALHFPLSFLSKSPQCWRALLNRCVGLHTYGQMGPFSRSSSFASPSLLPFPSTLFLSQ